MAKSETGTAVLWERFRNLPTLVQILAWIYLFPFILGLMALGRRSSGSGTRPGVVVGLVVAVVGVIASAAALGIDDGASEMPEHARDVTSDPTELVRQALIDVLTDGDFGDEVPGADGELRTSLELVQVTPVNAGGYMVVVQFVAGDNFTANARRETMVRETGRGMAAIYKTDHNISDVTIQAFFPVVDDLGNSSLAQVYEATLFRTDAMRANLDDPDRVNWQGLWNGGFTRDDF